MHMQMRIYWLKPTGGGQGGPINTVRRFFELSSVACHMSSNPSQHRSLRHHRPQQPWPAFPCDAMLKRLPRTVIFQHCQRGLCLPHRELSHVWPKIKGAHFPSRLAIFGSGCACWAAAAAVAVLAAVSAADAFAVSCCSALLNSGEIFRSLGPPAKIFVSETQGIP